MSTRKQPPAILAVLPLAYQDGRDCYAYKWITRNPHDYGDCIAMCYALAGADNITGMDSDTPHGTKNRRKVFNG